MVNHNTQAQQLTQTAHTLHTRYVSTGNDLRPALGSIPKLSESRFSAAGVTFQVKIRWYSFQSRPTLLSTVQTSNLAHVEYVHQMTRESTQIWLIFTRVDMRGPHVLVRIRSEKSSDSTFFTKLEYRSSRSKNCVPSIVRVSSAGI